MTEYLAPITMPTAGERIAERIVTAIALGEFVPDQRLPTERDLAAMLEVSRTTVREALQRLQVAGYVTTRRGRAGGTFVAPGGGPSGPAADLRPDAEDMIRRTLVPAWQELTTMLDFRSVIEQTIARAAAQRRGDGDVAAIRQAVADYARATDRDSSHLADHALHLAIAKATHNDRLVELSASIRREVSLGFDAEPWSPQVRQLAIKQHPTLADAVIAGDADQAAALAAEHFSLTEDLLRELHARIRVRTGG